MAEAEISSTTRRVVAGMLTGALLVLSYKVLQPFIVPVLWAAVLAYVTWPVYDRLRRSMESHPGGSALLMTLLLTAAFILPIVGLVTSLQDEAINAYREGLAKMQSGSFQLPEFVSRIPWLGEQAQVFVDRITNVPGALREEVIRRLEPVRERIFGDVGRNAGKLALALVTVFFLYRDGLKLLDQSRRAFERVLGDRTHRYLRAAGATTKAVVYGIIVTAIAQGALAALGYWGAGAGAPVLLGALTALLAMLPFGAPLVWVPIGVWLVVSGQTKEGIGLLVWGAVVVSWVDNLIRPLVISKGTRVPFLLVLFGVIGGLSSFGLIGLFIGPVLLSVLVSVWREWIEEQAAPDKSDSSS